MTDEKKLDPETVDAEAELKTLLATGTSVTAAGMAMSAAGTAMSAIGCLIMLPFLIGAVLLFGVVLWALIFGQG